MTLETIIKLFHKAGASKLYYTDPEAAQRVAQMIADAEREACAQICDSVNSYDNPMTANDVADAIRARKENT